MMGVCCCALAGTAACQHCSNNQFATEVWTNTVNFPNTNYTTFRKPKTPITNADRIRSMSDEELADKFEEIQLKTAKAYGNDDLLLKGELKKYWIDWFRQECE